MGCCRVKLYEENVDSPFLNIAVNVQKQEALDLFNYLTDNGILSRDSRSSIVYNLCLEGDGGGGQKLEPSCPIAQDGTEIKDEPTDVADHRLNDAGPDSETDQNYITNDDNDGYDEPDSPLLPQEEDPHQAVPRYLALDSKGNVIKKFRPILPAFTPATEKPHTCDNCDYASDKAVNIELHKLVIAPPTELRTHSTLKLHQRNGFNHTEGERLQKPQ